MYTETLVEEVRQDDDDTLIAQVKDGDQSAFSKIVEKYQAPIFRYVRRYVKNDGDAQDITQDIFIKVFRALPDWEPRATFQTWLYTIAKNRCIDHFRTHSRRACVPAITLETQGGQFLVNQEPTFLLGASYYGGLGASDDFVDSDLHELKSHGFNWIRVWATWSAFGNNVSAVDAEGKEREPYLSRLKRLTSLK